MNALQDAQSLPKRDIINARLDGLPGLYDISISREGTIASFSQHDDLHYLLDSDSGATVREASDAKGGLVAPSLCHSHVHLDKCFLLGDPKYSDLEIVNGDFEEAMKLTRQAKERFESADLSRRGRRLIRESLEAGVTAMRAFVEVDEIVQLRSLHAAIKMQGCEGPSCTVCEVQICAFAQLPLYEGDGCCAPDASQKDCHECERLCSGRDEDPDPDLTHTKGAHRRQMLEDALAFRHVDVVGTTPYVEDRRCKAEENVRWSIAQAIKHHKHLDFHLDYNLEADTTPLVPFVIDELRRQRWSEKALPDKKITFGHCTQLTWYSQEQWQNLKTSIGDLPISFVGLPTSDLFMMGRPPDESAEVQRPRGTLHIPQMIHKHGLQASISINNVGNAFTPWGNCDPLSVAHLGIGVYQAGTKQDTRTLYECVSTRAKNAIGLAAESASQVLQTGMPADLVIYQPGALYHSSPTTVSDIVYNPHTKRTVFFRGAKIDFSRPSPSPDPGD